MTRQQTWSKAALENVTKAKGRSEEYRKVYNTLCQKMPGLIQRSGLVQAVVFVQSRGAPGSDKPKKQAPVDFLGDMAATYGLADAIKLRERAQSAQLADYLALTRDMLDVSIWFRRFAQIELGDNVE